MLQSIVHADEAWAGEGAGSRQAGWSANSRPTLPAALSQRFTPNSGQHRTPLRAWAWTYRSSELKDTFRSRRGWI